jgi:hypothetical protein
MQMRMALIAVMQTVLLCISAAARELPLDFRPLFEDFQTHRRIAVGYLRTQNVELGAIEIERLRARWTFNRGKLQVEYLRDPALSSALDRSERLVAASLKSADGGDTERARRLLEEAAIPLDIWRKANGIRLFSDCIAEISAAYGRLDGFRLQTPDLNDRPVIKTIQAATNKTIAALDRCNREAAEQLKHEPEFRRLFDGMLNSLRRMPEAFEKRDKALLHRLLIEQRSFERLLNFRFG